MNHAPTAMAAFDWQSSLSQEANRVNELAPRKIANSAPRYRQLGLDDTIFARSKAAMTEWQTVYLCIA
jgi:DICT domain-containing protein